MTASRSVPMCAVLGLCGFLLCACSDREGDARPNVLLVTLDTTRVDALGCYGGPAGVSPTIDSFAREGVRFDQSYTSAPLTLPAHTSLLTGRYPDQHGVRGNSSYALPLEEITLAEILSEEGYSTAAFVASYVLDRQFGLAQGFQTYDDEIDVEDSPLAKVAERPGDVVTLRLLDWLAARDDERPFFVWLHYYDAHFPHELPAHQEARFDSLYHAEVAFVDSQLARVRARLQATGELHKTLVILTADHGEGQTEHGESTHGYFLYQGTQHIPLIFSHPSLAGGTVRTDAASLVDILPTTLAFLGIDPPALTSGLDLFAPARLGRGPLYMEAELGRIDFGLSPLYAALEGSYKLIGTPSPELYDLARDPREETNLASREPGRLAALGEWLEERRGKARLDAIHRGSAGAPERMRALGYTGGASDTEVTHREWTSDQLARWSRLSNNGMRHFQNGDLESAIEALRPLVSECPQAYAGQLFLGLALVRTGHLQAGLQHLERAVSMQPEASADAWWNLAVGRALSGQLPAARRALERTLKIEPEHVRALQKLAELCLQAEQVSQATGYLETLLQSAPQSAEGRWARGQLRKLRQ